MNRKREKSKIQPSELILELSTKIFVSLMIGIFPLFYLNNYINIATAKFNFFRMAAIIICAIVFFFGSLNRIMQREKLRAIRLSVTDIFAIAFLVIVLISCLFSPEGAESFLGNEGRRLGGFFLLLCIAVYFVISRCYKFSEQIFWILLIVNSIVWALMVLNFWNIDLLNMKSNLAEFQYEAFMGTVGNINVCAAYNVLLVTVFVVLFYLSRTKFSQRIYWGMIVLGFYACYATKSESWVIGTVLAMTILLWDALRSSEKITKYGMILSGFFVSSVLIKLSVILMEFTGLAPNTLALFKEQRLSNIFISNMVLAIEFCVLLIGWYITKKNKWTHLAIIRKWLFGIIAAVLVVAALLFFTANVSESEPKELQSMELQDSFGSYRGYIWKRTISGFGKLPVYQKIIGYGPNCYKGFINQHYEKEVEEIFHASLLDAHNEFLQYLATTGILGVISYFGILLSMAFRCKKRQKEKDILLLGTIVIGAYIGQGLVNNPQVFITPLLFVFLGVIESSLRNAALLGESDELV